MPANNFLNASLQWCTVFLLICTSLITFQSRAFINELAGAWDFDVPLIMTYERTYITTLCKLIGLNFERYICLDNNKVVIPLLLRKCALQKIDKNRTFVLRCLKKSLIRFCSGFVNCEVNCALCSIYINMTKSTKLAPLVFDAGPLKWLTHSTQLWFVLLEGRS